MAPPDRRRFDHFFAELSVSVGRLVPRYALWLRLAECGADPVRMGRDDLLAFFDSELRGFLAAERLALAPGAERRLRRRLARFDPQHPSPYEHMARLGDSRGAR